jgi:hypothetical protein
MLKRSKAAHVRAKEQLNDDVFNEAFGHQSARQIRKWSNRELHSWLTGRDLQPMEHVS